MIRAGNPTHDAEGAALEGKALDKAAKEMDKQRKLRAPLDRRLEEEGPGALQAMAAEVAQLEEQRQRLEKLAVNGGP